MQDFLDSFWEWFKEKTTSPLYATYAVCFVLHNWPIFFTLFFEDNTLLKVPKIEYVQQHFFERQGYWAVFDYLDVFGIPVLFTLAVILVLPKAITWAHELNVAHYFERKRIYEKALLAFEKDKSTDLKKLEVVKSEQASTIKRIEKTVPEVQVWEKEFSELRSVLSENNFEGGVRTVYENGGWVNQMPSGFLAFADVHGLIDFDKERNKVFLSPKGKYFAKKTLSSSKIDF